MALLLLAAVVAPLALGAGLVALFGLGRADALSRAGWTLALGGFGTACVVALWLAAGLAPDRGLVAGVGLPAVALQLLARRRARPVGGGAAVGADQDVDGPWERAGAPARALFLVVLAGVLAAAVQTMASGAARAVTDGDAAIVWTFKARLLFEGGGVGEGFEQLAAEARRPDGYWKPLDDWLERKRPALGEERADAIPQPMIERTYHLDYPLLNPLLQLYVFAVAGEVVPWPCRLPIQLMGLALLLVSAGALRAVCPPPVAAALLVIVFAMHETRGALRYAYSDGMVALGLLLAADGLRRAARTTAGPGGGGGSPGGLALASVGLALAVGSKHEGAMHALALVGGCAVTGLLPWRRGLAALVLPAAMATATWAFNARYGFGNDVASAGVLDPSRLGRVLGFFVSGLWSVEAWSDVAMALRGQALVPVMALLMLCAPRRSLSGWSGAVGLALIAISAGGVLVYLTTPHDVAWHMATSARRLAWQSLPLTALWIGAWWGRCVSLPPNPRPR